MPTITPKFDGSDRPSPSIYNGPPPPPGIYLATIRRMGIRKIQTGIDVGADRITLSLEIRDGDYAGARIAHSLNVTEQGAPYANQFLESLSDGRESQKTAIRHAFWKVGYKVGSTDDGQMVKPFEQIGADIKPIGMTCAFRSKMSTDLSGNTRAAVASFIVPDAVDDADDGFTALPDEDDDTYASF